MRKGDIMKKLLSLWRKLTWDWANGLIAGLISGGIVFYLLAMFLIIFGNGGERLTFTDAVVLLVVFQAVFTLLSVIILLARNHKSIHKFDSAIIGDNFIGMSKKSRTFRNGVEMFHSGEFREALEVFTDLEEPVWSLNETEQGIVSFYRGRCYNIMGCYPNAIICYEKALEEGFTLPEMPVFIARCHAENGSTDRAVELMTELIDSKKAYSERARYEIGMIYLKLNDGENALKWFDEAIRLRESYPEALGGAAIAHTILHHLQEGETFYRKALLNNIENSIGFTRYYKEVQAAVVLETHINRAEGSE